MPVILTCRYHKTINGHVNVGMYVNWFSNEVEVFQTFQGV